MAQAVPLLAEALTAQNAFSSSVTLTATAPPARPQCVLALRAMGGRHIDFLVPNRFEFGYGLTPEIVELAVARGAEFLITVDNGISSIAGVAAAKAAGMQVLVTDHHLPGQELPDADAIVNPNQHGCDFPSKSLAGVGVAFYLMAALNTHLRQSGWYERQGCAPQRGGLPGSGGPRHRGRRGRRSMATTASWSIRVLQRIRAGRCRPGIQALVDVSGRDGRRLCAADPALRWGRASTRWAGSMTCPSGRLSAERGHQPGAPARFRNGQPQPGAQGDRAGDAAGGARHFGADPFRDGEVPSGIVLHRDEWHQGWWGWWPPR